MKKMLATLLAIMMLTPAFALADNAATDTAADAAVETEVAAETTTNNYEIVNDVQTLTVRMPANATTGYEWSYEISDESKLELLTGEYYQDENAEGLLGAGGTWAATFKRADDATGDVTLTLNYAKGEEAPLYTVVITINTEDSINITDVTNGEEAAWATTDEEGTAVNITLPSNPTTGYDWTYTASDPAMFEAEQNYTEDEHEEGMVGVGGTWSMKLTPTMVSAGKAVVTFDYARAGEDTPIDTHTLELFVNEAGLVTITNVTAELVENIAE